MTPTDKKRLKAAQKRAEKARNPSPGMNTCPASRHAHIMADCLAKGKPYPMFTEEPQHCAETLYAVISALWEARTELARLQSNRTGG
jgi:hypothetical protein